MRERRLDFFDERTASIDTIIIHCTAFDVDQAVETYREAQVSAHYIIDLNGRIIRLVDEEKRAWHAGKSFWKGRESLNNNSIGIEVCSLSLGQHPYDKRQIFALIRLCKRLMRKYHIKKENVLGHSDIAPKRKADPGKCFPWKVLARRGIGRWYKMPADSAVLKIDEVKFLSAIGYDTEDITAARWAFCRHYLPDAVPVDENIGHLLDNPYPSVFTAINDDYFRALIGVLQAVDKQK